MFMKVKGPRLASALLEDGYVHSPSQVESQIGELFPKISCLD